MDVKMTVALDMQMQADKLDPGELIAAFSEWKSSNDEYSSYFFGKDAAYAKPAIFGMPRAFRHVHLVPMTDADQLIAWNKAWKRRGRKTSDRALVYVDADGERYLLIFILSEPDAHAIGAMKTQKDKALMHAFVDVATAFINTGAVVR